MIMSITKQILNRLNSLNEAIKAFLYARSWVIGIAGILLCLGFVLSIRANAQEVVIDTPVEVAIEVTPEPEPVQQADTVGKDTPIDTPPLEGGVVVEVGPAQENAVQEAGPIISNPRNEYDDMRLQIMSAQALSFESTGEYTQVSKTKEVIAGDEITFDAVKESIFTGKEEVHVYEAPCGRGWQLIVYDDSVLVESYQYDSQGKKVPAYVPTVRTYGYGCEHESRTVNW